MLAGNFSGQSSKSSCHCFQMAKCFHVYEPFCKVKTFTKRHSHLKTLHGVFYYEIVAFFEILLVYMLAVLLGDDLVIIIIIKYLYSTSGMLCRFQNVNSSSIKFFSYLVRAGLVAKNCVISMLLQYYGLDHVLARKSSGQSSKSSCRGFHKAKCFHV